MQEKDCADWYSQAEASYARFENAEKDATKRGQKAAKRFNIHWSNIQVLKPALLSQEPKVNCGLRHKDKNPIGLMAAQILERATQFSIDDGSKFLDAAKAARDDYLLAARGTLWIRYEPTYGEEKADRIPVTLKPFQGYYDDKEKRYDKGEILEDDMGTFVEGETYKPVVNERVDVEFKHYRDLVNGPAGVWAKVPWVAARHHMRKRAIADRFGKACAAHIQQNKDDSARKNPKDGAASRDTTPIWEIWDKERGQVRWVCEFYKDGFLDEIDDPLNLGDFFPCPRPLYGTLTPDSLIPTPDYEQYKDQALELDRLTDRGLRISKSIRVAGVYDGGVKELQKLFNESDTDNYVAVPTWAAFADKGGLKSAMDTLPLDDKVKALKAIYEVRQAAKADLYEVTGISDIMRGDTDPNETKGAQTLKANFGSKRLKERQAEVARFVRDTVALVAEVIAEHFAPEQILKMSGAHTLADPQDPNSQQMVMAALQLLKDQGARDFEIDIETDSTVAIDEEADKQSTVEFVTAVTGYLEKAAMISQGSPAMQPLLLDMLMFAVRRFRAGRDLEATFEKTVDAVGKEQQERAANPQPDPEMQKLQAEMQAKQQEMQLKQQSDQQQMQFDAQKHAAEMQMKMEELQLKREEMALKREEMQLNMQAQLQQHAQSLHFEREKHGNEMQMRSQEGEQAQAMKREEMAHKSQAEASKAQAKSGEGEGDDDMKVNLAPEIQQAIAHSITQERAARQSSAEASAKAAEAAPQAFAQAVQQMTEAATAIKQLAKVIAAPSEIQVDKKTGKKRAVKVAA